MILAKAIILIASLSVLAASDDCKKLPSVIDPSTAALSLEIFKSSDTVFPTLKESVDAHVANRMPIKFIETKLPTIPRFPSFSRCEKSFFRVATINKTIDEVITETGWKSGWVRKSDQYETEKIATEHRYYDALHPSAPIEDRIVEYVRVKNVPAAFPKDSSVVGVLEDPIKTLSVGYHTGMNASYGGNHMRMDEIEVGPCAQAPECQKLAAVDSTKVFEDKGLEPRYSTEGEWAVDSHIPAACIVATYRITFQKVDDVCYSDKNGNCSF